MMCPHRNHLHRGSVYVMVLGVSMMVSIIGVSALLAVRIQHRTVRAAEAAVQAGLSANSTIELAIFGLNNDPNWRENYLNDTWTSETTIQGADLSMKLVDERDGDLENDLTQSVRLHGRAKVGPAVRIYSVLLQAEKGISPNLFVNGAMEGGIAPWLGKNCVVVYSITDPHGGARALRAAGRGLPTNGPRVDVDSVLTSDVTYNIEGWVKMNSGSDVAMIELWTVSSIGGTVRWDNGNTTPVRTAWTRMAVTLTPSWSGVLTSAFVIVRTLSGTTDLFIDDMRLAEATGPIVMHPAPGTWQREVLP